MKQAKFELLLKTDKKLRSPNTDIDPNDPDLPGLIEKMYEKMYEWNGIGLAAPQFGLNKRIAVIDTGRGDRYVLINPEITFYSKDTSMMEEGCLNFPGEYLKVVRPSKIRIKFQEVGGKTIKMKASGLLAKVMQHETDHLNKLLIVDRATNE